MRSDADRANVSAFLHTGCCFDGRRLNQILRELFHSAEAEASIEEPDEPPTAPPPGRWFYISDSKVCEVTSESSVLNREAYLLFYERLY